MVTSCRCDLDLVLAYYKESQHGADDAEVIGIDLADGGDGLPMDAFTVSDSYPYSTHYSLGDSSINYMRNSVKVVVDAYNGATTLRL
jgi:Uncharacterised protein family (UPF0182)